MSVKKLAKTIKKPLFTGVLILLTLAGFAQENWQEVKTKGKGTLEVYIQEEFPFAYYEDDQLVGIEVDLLRSFVKWTKIRHGVDVNLEMHVEKEFFKVFDAVKQNKNTLGSASITITDERKKDVDFSAPYLNNKSVLVSPLSFETLSSYSDFSRIFSEGTAVVIRETTHEKELMGIKQKHFNEMVVDYQWTTNDIRQALSNNKDFYTMIDLLTFWSWVRDGELGMKVHRVATVEKEEFGFALSKNSDWTPIINEFFEGGFGFTASREYLNILETYLPEEVLSEVR